MLESSPETPDNNLCVSVSSIFNLDNSPETPDSNLWVSGSLSISTSTCISDRPEDIPESNL